MLKKKFQLVGGSKGSGELKNKLLNKCWKKSFFIILNYPHYNRQVETFLSRFIQEFIFNSPLPWVLPFRYKSIQIFIFKI